MRGRRDPITALKISIDCLPTATKQAMLDGIRCDPIVVGAYTDGHGGICPMLAAHRRGGRTSFLAFARSWDAFAQARRVRPATTRELRTLEALLVTSLTAQTDFGQAIAEHREALARRPMPEIRARRLSAPFRSGRRAAAGAAARTA